MSKNLPETWDDLLPLLRAAKPGEWVRCMAWAVGGGDPDGLQIRVAGGRAVFDAAWCVCTEERDRVRLARLESRDGYVHEVGRYVDPEAVVEVRKDTRFRPEKNP